MPIDKSMSKKASSDPRADLAALLRAPVIAGRHLAVWIVFQSTRISLVE